MPNEAFYDDWKFSTLITLTYGLPVWLLWCFIRVVCLLKLLLCTDCTDRVSHQCGFGDAGKAGILAEGFPTLTTVIALLSSVSSDAEQGTSSGGRFSHTLHIHMVFPCVDPSVFNEAIGLALKAFRSLYIDRVSLQCGSADVQSGLTSGWRFFHILHIHMASPQCGFSGAEWELNSE